MTLDVAQEPVAAHPFARHVLERTIVLPEQRVLFVPVPKAGCTSTLWLLARLAGVPLEAFERSGAPEVSPALTIHDASLWPPGHRLTTYAGDERARILDGDGWFRFALVRDPARRLWSAWQTKLLLREPRFVEAFRDAPWFPSLPDHAGDLVADFRRFVAAVGAGDARDVHWAVQRDLAEQLPLDHVGRVERMGDTLRALRTHVGDARLPAAVGRENRSLLALPPGAYDAEAAAVLARHFAPDLEAFGYGPPPAGSSADWEREAAALLPALRATIDANERIGQLHQLAARRQQRARSLQERLEVTAARQVGHARAAILHNLEEEVAFDVRWAWADGPLDPGFTAVLRVKNEARTLPWALPPLLRAASRIVLVDNGSTDGSAAVARRVAAENGAVDRLEVRDYPFTIARCGSEHLGTPPASVHSLAYFYNWSFAHVRTAYALKWDGDMVLTDHAAATLRDLAWQLEFAEAVVRIPRHALYVLEERRAFLDTELRNCEPWAWPNRPGYSFVKAADWELPLWGGEHRDITLPEWSCVELKHLDADEFTHWSHTDFDASARTQRKRREWSVSRALAAGGPPPAGVVAIDAPPGRHVIDHVRETWLPARARQSAQV